MTKGVSKPKTLAQERKKQFVQAKVNRVKRARDSAVATEKRTGDEAAIAARKRADRAEKTYHARNDAGFYERSKAEINKKKVAAKKSIRSKPSTAERTKLENDYDMYQARHGLSDPETQAKARKTMAAQQRFHKRRGDDGKRSK